MNIYGFPRRFAADFVENLETTRALCYNAVIRKRIGGIGMTDYDALLQTLGEQTARLQKLNAMLETLYARRDTLEARERELEAARADEQADVDRLEGHSLSALFYSMLGKKEERLDRERQEAFAAAVRHDSVLRELQAVRQDIARYEAERAALDGCEARYAQALCGKREALKAAGSAQAGRILQLEQEIAAQQALDREIGEAADAGRAARDTAEGVLDTLRTAADWGTFDMIGGGLVSTMVKHNRLDTAQEQIGQLQVQLGRFRTELSDVTVRADVQANVDGFLRMADYLFDNPFVDWMVLEHIQRSRDQIRQTAGQIDAVLDRLQAMQDTCRAALRKAQDELDSLVRSA